MTQFDHLTPRTSLPETASAADWYWARRFPYRSSHDNPCPICGNPTPCAYDKQGRGLIHTHPED